jgi:hypothetical protein
MPRVPAKKTAYTSPARFCGDVIAAAIASGLSREAAEVLCAHAAHETGYGRQLWGYNLSGMKGARSDACPPLADYPRDDYPHSPTDYQPPPDSDWGYDFACLVTTEGAGENARRYRHPFRMWATMQEGVDATLDLLQKPRYAKSWALLQAADTGYFRQVGIDGWYTASLDKVEAGTTKALAWIRANVTNADVAAGTLASKVPGGIKTIAGMLVGAILLGVLA